MSREIPQSNQSAVNSPPRGGRTSFQNGINAENAAFISTSRTPANAAYRQLTAEHDANLTHGDGDYTGTGSRFVPLIGPTFLTLSALVFIAAALTFQSKHPAPHACIHPTAMPATWFGDCGGDHTSQHDVPGLTNGAKP